MSEPKNSPIQNLEPAQTEPAPAYPAPAHPAPEPSAAVALSLAAAGHRDEWVEDYLLGRLSPDQQVAFEEHFIDCPRCLDELEAAQRLRAAGRQLAVETLSTKILPFSPRPAVDPVESHGRGPRFWQRLAAVAATLCLAVLLASWLQIRDLHQRLAAGESALAAALAPRADTPTLTLGQLRGEAPSAQLHLAGAPAQVVLLATAPGDGHGEYRVSLTRGQHELWQTAKATADHRGELVIVLPSHLLEPGEYRLAIADDRGTLEHRFSVKR